MNAKPWRLLVVDDNEDNRLTLSERLAPEELSQYTISGYGGSDLTPAMELPENGTWPVSAS